MRLQPVRARLLDYGYISKVCRRAGGSRNYRSSLNNSSGVFTPRFLIVSHSVLPGTATYSRSIQTMSTPISQFSLDPGIFNSALFSRLCALWFPNLTLPASTATPLQMSRWFGVGANADERAEFDAQCRSVASEALLSIGPNKVALPAFTDIGSDQANYPKIVAPFVKYLDRVKDTEKQATEALGLILLLDQMTRNCHRDDQSLIYAHYDRIARAVSYAIYTRGLDKSNRYRHSPPWRVWFYLPMMHSEALSDHEVLSQNLEEMGEYAKAQGDAQAIGYLNNTLNYERKHYDTLARFGRYPHRNRVLGRQSTAAEKEYLESGGDTFGT